MKRYLDSIGIKVTAFFVSGRNRFDPEICCNIPVLVFDEHYISDNSFILICIACTSDIICKFKEIENYCCMDESMYLEICAMGALEKNDSVVIENKRELLQKNIIFQSGILSHILPNHTSKILLII